MNSSQSPRIEEFKIQASILLKDLRSQDPERVAKALARLQKIPPFNQWSLAKNRSNIAEVKRKHALEVIACEQAHPSWRALLEAESKLLEASPAIEMAFVNGGFLHVWFASLSEAKAYVEKEGGYLLAYKNHYFAAGENYLSLLGLDPLDPRWPIWGKGRSCLKIKLR